MSEPKVAPKAHIDACTCGICIAHRTNSELWDRIHEQIDEISKRDATIAELRSCLEKAQGIILGDMDKYVYYDESMAEIEKALDSSPSELLERVEKLERLHEVVKNHVNRYPESMYGFLDVALEALKEKP